MPQSPNSDSISDFIQNGCYTGNIKVAVGSNTIKLSAAHLNISEEVSNALKRSKASKTTLVILASLKKLKHKLETERRRLHDNYMFNLGDIRVISRNNLYRLHETYQKMESLVEKYFESLDSGLYEEEKSDFIQRASSIVYAAYPLEQAHLADQIVTNLDDFFPTLAQLRQQIQVEITSILEIPSVVSVVEHDTEKMKTLNSHLTEHQKLIHNQLLKKSSEDLLDMIATAYEDARVEVFELVTSTITDLEDLSCDKVGQRHRKQVSELIERFGTLQEVDSSLESITSHLKDLSSKIQGKSNDSASLKETLEEIKEEVKASKSIPRLPKSATVGLTL